MSWWSKFREYDRKGLFQARLEGWKLITDGGYVFDRRVFLTFMVLVVLASTGVFLHYGLKEYAYVSCPNESQTFTCTNPLYGKCDREACQQQEIPRGVSIGEQAPRLLTNWGWYVALAFGLTFVVNHVLWNRKFEFGGDE